MLRFCKYTLYPWQKWFQYHNSKEYIYKEDIVDDKKKCYNIVEEEKIYTNSKVLPIRNIIYDTNPLTGNVIKRQVKYNDSTYEEMD